ncbi:MAG: hypothetical protein JJU00_08385 [Opitutales bacterium]|nr:hypothetical protein [Opitutales bacterium]
MPTETPFAPPQAKGLEAIPARTLPLAFRGTAPGQALHWTIPAGALAADYWIVADFHYDEPDQTTFRLELSEGGEGPRFVMTFSVLPGVRARLQLPLARLDLNRWALMREGALLKRCCYGDRVQPTRVTRVVLALERTAESAVTWEMTLPVARSTEPPRLERPALAGGPLVDPLGQSLRRSWPGRTTDAAEMTERLLGQRQAAQTALWPDGYSRWGGWTAKRFAATGFFRLEQDNRRFWFVDPDGHPYWSAAVDCVRSGTPALVEGIENTIEDWDALRASFPECIDRSTQSGIEGEATFDFVRANLAGAFGRENCKEAWADTIVGILRETGFNGFGNWSDSETASARSFPYVHPLKTVFARTPKVFRDFPDVWHSDWMDDVREFAAQLVPLRGDPALIGYFLMNEPKWGFASQTPAEGMLLNTGAGPARSALAAFLRDRYTFETDLAAAWEMHVSFADIEDGRVFESFGKRARADLAAFSTVMARRFFTDLSEACRKVDPDHLNLGARYYTLPPDWLADAMGVFDVFSMNAYEERIPAEGLEQLHRRIGLPVLIGEWHFGALDVGLPMAGICRVANQSERGKAYRRYLEDAAARPWCVGAHYFQLYDQPYLGRFDGENWNIGLIDICHRVYGEFATAARHSHERLYAVANGDSPPFDGTPDYRPRHFC